MISSFHGSVARATVASCLLLTTVIAGAPPASAAPHIDRYQNREFSRVAAVAEDTFTATGRSFRYFGAYQSFDRKGLFQYAEVYIYEEVFDGPTVTIRETACPADPSALQISATDATFTGSIDTDGCFFNDAYSYNFMTDDFNYLGAAFSGSINVAGSWQGATETESTQSHGRFNSPAETFNYTCQSRVGRGHDQVAVSIDGSSWASGGFITVAREDCNRLSKSK